MSRPLRDEYGQKCWEDGFNSALDGLVNKCKEVGAVYREMMSQALKEDGHGASPTGAISAYAYFDLRRDLVEILIPSIIEEYRNSQGEC